MIDEELKDLSRYFRLSGYRDSDYFLLDEYYELNDIIRRNSIARELEEARYKCIKGIIAEEEYNKLCNKYLNIISRKQKIKD